MVILWINLMIIFAINLLMISQLILKYHRINVGDVHNTRSLKALLHPSRYFKQPTTTLNAL